MRRYFIARVADLFRILTLLSVIAVLNSCHDSIRNAETSILFAGDLLLDRGVALQIRHRSVDALFSPGIDSLFHSAEYVVANLECPATHIYQPINKKYIFRADPSSLPYLRKHGITHLNMANNHTMDQGREGLTDTYENIVKAGMVPLGYGENINEACKEKLISVSPKKVYILSSLQVPSENWSYFENKACICEESIEGLVRRIRKIIKREPEAIIIVQLHWGTEHTSVPATIQKQQAYQLIDAGAACIIGHHTHTIQMIENYKEKPVFYSIGNFIFDQSKEINSEGMLVKLRIYDHSVQVDTIRVIINRCTAELKKW